MNLIETSKTSYTALRSNKVRSFLTMLGVIIGVFSVSTLISLGRGIQNYITDEFNSLGSNLIFISPGKVDFSDDPAKSLTNNKLEEKHLDLINLYAGQEIAAVTPYIVAGENAVYKTKEYYSEVSGLSYQAFALFNYNVVSGREFTKSEERAGARVAVLGPKVASELFQKSDPIGKRVKLGDKSYMVIGVFKEKGSNYDDQILVPYTSAMTTFDLKNFSSIVAKIKPTRNVDISIRTLELALLRDLKADDFTVLSQQDLLKSIEQILAMLTAGLGAIAGISLVVGGIGIMNIMLVSVTERIKEIGLRKALGATSRMIGLQFLIESLMLSLAGGGIGLLLGYGASLIARNFVRTEMPASAILLSFGFSAVVGVIFGTYPAYSASKKEPIDALRYE